MPRYYVIGPEYGTVDVVFDGIGPMEYGHDVLEIDAPNARAAKVEAVRQWRQQRARSIVDAYSDGRSPFTGVRAERVLKGET